MSVDKKGRGLACHVEGEGMARRSTRLDLDCPLNRSDAW